MSQNFIMEQFKLADKYFFTTRKKNGIKLEYSLFTYKVVLLQLVLGFKNSCYGLDK